MATQENLETVRLREELGARIVRFMVSTTRGRRVRFPTIQWLRITHPQRARLPASCGKDHLMARSISSASDIDVLRKALDMPPIETVQDQPK